MLLTIAASSGCQGSAEPPQKGCVCTMNYDPVCGTDGVTYSNRCGARCAGAAVASEGRCSP